MGQAQINEVNYFDFLEILKHATNLGKKIEKTDKDRWTSFVRENKVPEAGLKVHAAAGVMSGKIKEVIIEGIKDTTDGYYLYSDDEQFCLKYS